MRRRMLFIFGSPIFVVTPMQGLQAIGAGGISCHGPLPFLQRGSSFQSLIVCAALIGGSIFADMLVVRMLSGRCPHRLFIPLQVIILANLHCKKSIVLFKSLRASPEHVSNSPNSLMVVI